MPASFTLSEFSELVAAALDGPSDYGLQVPGGGDGASRAHGIHLRDTPSLTPRHTNTYFNQSNDTKGLVPAFPYEVNSSSLFSFDSQSSANLNSPYTRYYNSTRNMLLISPPGPGPLPPSVTPILSASMSTVDLSANCLSLGMGMGHGGCGGAMSKSALEAMDAENEMHLAGTPLAVASSSASPPTASRHRSLALFAKIKRQLSKSNMVSSIPPESPLTTQFALAQSPEAGRGAIRGRALTVSSGIVPPAMAVSFAHSPSFHPASLAGADSSSNAPFSEGLSNDISAPDRHSHQKRRLRRRSSGSDSLVSLSASMARSYSCDNERSNCALSDYSGESAFVGGSLASYVDVGEPSIIGSSASFFAALSRGRDGRTGRRGSGTEEDENSGLFEQAGFEGEFGFPDPVAEEYWGVRHGHSQQEPTKSEDSSHDGSGNVSGEMATSEVDAQSMESYMPYLPLAMQLERKGLKTRVSVEDVASVACSRTSMQSRTSLQAPSVSSRGRQHQAANDLSSASMVRPKSKSNTRSPLGTKTRKHVPPPLKSATLPPRLSGTAHPFSTAQPYSPASSASSRSPITPSTPFFTASEASLEDEQDNESRISAETTAKLGGSGMHKTIGARLSSDTFGQGSAPPPQPPSIHVQVDPPTPTMRSVVPRYADVIDREATSQTPSATNLHIDTSNIVDDGVVSLELMEPRLQLRRSYSTSKLRAARQNYKNINISPPMSPPPSGPLPLPPTSSISCASEKSKATSIVHHRSLSPEASLKWVAPQRTSRFSHTLLREGPFLDKQENDVDVSGISASMSDLSADHEPLFVQPQSSDEAASTTGDSEYASFASEWSVDSADTSQTEERLRAAILEANTHASAFNGLFHASKAKIGIGRQQVATHSVEHKQPDVDSDAEWTLGLGMPTSSMRFPSMGSTLSQSTTPSVKRVQITSVATVALPAVSSDDERLSLRERTKSESALGMGSKARKTNRTLDHGGDETRGAGANEDWTLSMPLPAFSARKTTKSGATIHEPSRDFVEIRITKADPGVQTCVDDVEIDARTDTSDGLQDSVLDTSGKGASSLEDVVICVPRIVTPGSGIENGTRLRTLSGKRQLTVFEISEDESDDSTSSTANENLAKLDALSADLERFNEMLRVGGSQIRRSTEGRSRYLGSMAASSSHLSVPRTVRSGLKHTRSLGVIEVDEPPPKNAIMRTTSIGNLLGMESPLDAKMEREATSVVPVDMSPTPTFALYAPLEDNSPTLPHADMSRTDLGGSTYDLSLHNSCRLPTELNSKLGPLPTSLSVRNGSICLESKRISSCSTSSTVTVKATKPRTMLPLASPPSAFQAYKAPAGKTGPGSNVDLPLRLGLASGSALPRAHSSPALKPEPSVPNATITDAALCPSVPCREGNSSSSITCFKTPLRASSLTITTTLKAPPAQSTRSRCVSTSSVSSANSTGSLTPTLSPVAYDSSAYSTPVASSFPVPPSFYSLNPSAEETHHSRPASANTVKNSPIEVAVPTPDKKRNLSPSTTPSPKVKVLTTLEERIKQLRELGMDAVTVRNAGTSLNTTPSSARTASAKGGEGEVDEESGNSDAFYSARSSFSSAR